MKYGNSSNPSSGFSNNQLVYNGMSHTFFFVMPSSALRISQVSCVPLLLGHRAPMPCRLGRCTPHGDNVVLVRLFCMQRWHMCIARCRWFQIAFISCYFYPLPWDDDPI